MTADTITAIKKALEDLDALVTIVAKETGALVMSDPDEDSVGSTLEGDLEMTFGHVRRAHAALKIVSSSADTQPAPSVTVKKLDWADDTICIQALTSFGFSYEVFLVDWEGEPYWQISCLDGRYKSEIDAKETAQAHHDAAVLAALSRTGDTHGN